MSDTWGKGAKNNTIGWGQAAGSATNNWGESQKTSWAGQTDIVGITSVSIAYSSSAFCADASDPTPTISNNAGVGIFSSTTGLVFISTTTGEVDLDASTAGATYVITYTDTDTATATFSLTINDLDNAGFSYSASSYEPTDADPTPTITGLTGGTFSGTTGLVINSATGEIDLSASTVASHTVTYTTSGNCPNSSTFALSIVSAAFGYSASAYCQDASDPTPTVTGTSGGTFTAAEKFFPFQMQFEVASGVSKTITIPNTVGSSYTVDWGDGATTTETGGTITHTYNDGTYTDVTNPTVSIGAESDTGAFTSFRFQNGGSKSDLLDVPQWGSIVWSDGQYMFQGCNNTSFQISATEYPDMSNVTNITYMFNGATYFNSNINHWDVSTITNLFGLFRHATNYNQPLNSWDVSSATNFERMFDTASSFNSDISSWDMSSCENSRYMFQYATSFNQNISGWNFSSAWTNPYNMFFGASSFNQNLGSWNLSSVTTIFGMFRNCTNFNNNGGTLSSWNVSSVTNMSRTFQSTSFNQNLGSWSLNSSLTDASLIFASNTALSQANYTDTLVGWANTVFTNSAPYSVDFTGNSFSTKFDATRSGGANFITAQDAYDYLIGATASWSIS